MVLSDLAFSDEVINSTQLIRNWGHWAARAHSQPVTILYKDAPITLISRRYISDLKQRLHYTSLILNVSQFIDGRIDNCDFLPWLIYLDKDLHQEFLEDTIKAYLGAEAKSNWNILQNALDDWKATTEVANNPQLSKRLMEKDDPSKYIEIKD